MRQALALLLWLTLSVAAAAQGCGPTNPNCVVPTAPPGTSDNRAASTAFVTQAIGGGGGGGSGSTLTVISAATISTVSIPNATTLIHAQTVAAPASGQLWICPLQYYKGTATPLGLPGEIFNAGSGVYWEPMYSTSPVRACQFGTVPDAQFNFSAFPATPTGTDNTAAIQAALDYAMRYVSRGQPPTFSNNAQKTVCIDDGAYLVSDTIAVGWGMINNTASPTSLALMSCNMARASYSTFSGVTIISTKYDRCAINVSGGRQTLIRGIHLLGGNYVWASTRFGLVNTGSNPATAVPSTAAGWLDPALPQGTSGPGGLNRTSPYAGFCVDAYNGAPPPNGIAPAPAAPYPAQTFPAWTGNTMNIQYNQAGSTDTIFESTSVEGFAIGWNIASSTGQQNGDFNGLRDSYCANTVYCVSFGSTQSRVGLMNNVHCNNVYTFLTNLQFGARSGELGGSAGNVACGQMYQWFDINLSIASLSVTDIYSEASVRIGNIAGNMTFKNCTFSFSDASTGIMPATLITPGVGINAYRFQDCKISGHNRIGAIANISSNNNTIVYDGGTLFGGGLVGTLVGAAGNAGQNAVNYTAGYLIGAFQYPNVTFTTRLMWGNSSLAASMSSATATTSFGGTGWQEYPFISSAVRQYWTQAMKGFIDGNDFMYWQFLRGPRNITVDFTSVGNFPATNPLVSTGCDTWGGQYSASQQMGQGNQLVPGDIIFHQLTGTVFVVESVQGPAPTNYPVVLRQHNNMIVVGSPSGNGTPNVSTCAQNNLSTYPSGNSFLIHVGQNLGSTSAAVSASGSGYAGTTGVLTLNVTAAVCPIAPAYNVTISGGAVTGVTSSSVQGICTGSLPSNPVATTGGGGTGATLNVTFNTGSPIAIPGTVFYCDIFSGQTTYTCDRGDNNGTTMASVLQVGDKFWSSVFNDPAQQWPFGLSTGTNLTLTAVTNGSPGTVTVSQQGNKTGRFPLLPFLTNIMWTNTANRGAAPTRPVFTIAGLPACTAAVQAGQQAAVTNGVAGSAVGAAVGVTTGTAWMPVTCSGTGGWVYG